MHAVQFRGQQWHLSGISLVTVLSVVCLAVPESCMRSHRLQAVPTGYLPDDCAFAVISRVGLTAG